MIPIDRHSRGPEHALKLVKLEGEGARRPGLDPAPWTADERIQSPHLRLVRPEEDLHPALRQRDPAFIRRIYPYMAGIADRYYRAEVEGVEHMSDRASLVISTHNGGMYMPDMFALQVAFWRRFGMETPAYGMAHKAVLGLPLARDIAPKLGAVYASPENARLVLEADAPLLICPGGDKDSLKPFSRRHTIRFGERMGFIRTALRHQVPIIPVVSVGAHEVFYSLTEGKRLARLMRFDKMFRIKAVPLTIGFPLGLTPAGIFHIPLPSKVKVRVLEPMHFDEPASAEHDPEVVQRLYGRVVDRMQAAVDDMAAERKWPVLG